MQQERLRAQIDHANVLPETFFENEGFSFVKYDRYTKQYTLDQEDIPLQVRDRFGEGKFDEAISKLNEMLKIEGAKPPLGLPSRIAMILFLISFVLLAVSMALILTEEDQELIILGLICILLALATVAPVFYACKRSLLYKGSYFYYTPKVKKLLQELNQHFEPRKVKWALGKRVIGLAKKYEHEAFDLLYILWSENEVAI